MYHDFSYFGKNILCTDVICFLLKRDKIDFDSVTVPNLVPDF